MARVKKVKKTRAKNKANVGYKAELWKMADALRGSMDAANISTLSLASSFLSTFPMPLKNNIKDLS